MTSRDLPFGRRRAVRPACVSTTGSYETVGFVISGRADVEIDRTTVELHPGDSWWVPVGATHRYRILDSFTAVEADAPITRTS